MCVFFYVAGFGIFGRHKILCEGRPHTQHNHRTRWSRRARPKPTGNQQRLSRARRQRLRPKRGDNSWPTPTTAAAQATGAEDKHQAHTPQVPPPWCTVHTREHPESPMQRPNGTRAITPAPPTQPDPTGGGRQGIEQHNDNCWTRTQTTPHHNIQTTAPAPQTEPQAPHQSSVHRAWTARSIAPKTRTTVTYRDATPTNLDSPSAQGRRTQLGLTRGGQPEGRLRDLERDHTLSQRTDYRGRATNRTTSTIPRRRTRALDARSIAPKTRTTATYLYTGHDTTTIGTMSGARTTNGAVDHGGDAATHIRGPHTRSITIRVQRNNPLPSIHPCHCH